MDAQTASAADDAVVAEVQRLDTVFSTYRADSELCRWGRGELDRCSPDLRTVLAAAERWWRFSDGAFHPATGQLRGSWLNAERAARLPTEDELEQLRRPPLPFRVDHADAVHRVADCTGVDLNAIAKGYIVDRAVAAALAVDGVRSVLVNAGGDLRQAGAGAVDVGIEDPYRPFDNLPPRWRIRIADTALATSGSARRGFRINGQRLGHVLDPASGRPADHVASVSVLAPDALTADALATVFGVWPVARSLAEADRMNLACLIVGADREVSASAGWLSRTARPTRP